REQLAPRGGLAAAIVVVDRQRELVVAAEPAVDQRRLAYARRADQGDRVAGPQVGGERVEAIAGVGADRGDRHARCGGGELGERLGEVDRVDQVDLADDDDRRSAAVPRRGEIALDAPGAGVAVGRGDD